MRAALVIIVMQRDFLEPGGFGAALRGAETLLVTGVTTAVCVHTTAREASVKQA
ncbi:hypothetical protein [Bosea thiooxidans]